MIRIPQSTELITQDEIKRLKTNPRQMSWKDIVPGKGLAVRIIPIELKSEYLVSYTIDAIFEFEPNLKLEHAMVGAEKFEPDPADVDEIAQLILGDCFRPPAEWGDRTDGAHYVKIIGMDDKEMKRFREEGIERGVTVITSGSKNEKDQIVR